MRKIAVSVDGRSHVVEIDLRAQAGAERTVVVDGEPVRVSVPENGHGGLFEWMMIDGRPYEVVLDPNLRWIRSATGLHRLDLRDLEAVQARPASGDGRVKAPIPGRIARVLVRPGDRVEAGATLVVLEAMKMENHVGAPRAGVVFRVPVRPGRQVRLNDLLVEIA